jgi:hypothetical protein
MLTMDPLTAIDLDCRARDVQQLRDLLGREHYR